MYHNELKLKIMSNSKVLVGFLVGAAVGGALGLLLAPDKGSETRKKIIETGNDPPQSIGAGPWMTDSLDQRKQRRLLVHSREVRHDAKVGNEFVRAR